MRGSRRKISIARRIVIDLMYFSRRVPTIPIQRRMNLAPLVAARSASPARPPWPALFAKAFALVARGAPSLRSVYLEWPIPHLFEFEASVASITVERDYQGEKAVFAVIIKDPAAQSLDQIAGIIRSAATSPVKDVRDFQRAIRVARLPLPLRRLIWWIGLASGRQRGNYFGSFAISTVAGLGGDLTHVLSPFPVLLNYGVIGADGDVDVRIVFDHRSLDGAEAARALRNLEEALLGPIVEELAQL